MTIPTAKSYGVVLFNEDGHVLLRKVTNDFGGARWSFAKGKKDPGETPRQAAIREAREETGYEVQLGAPLPKAYKGTTGETAYFVARVKPGTEHQAHGWETEKIEWVPPEKAAEYIKTSPDKTVVARDLAVFADAHESWKTNHTHWHKQSAAPKKEVPKSPLIEAQEKFEKTAKAYGDVNGNPLKKPTFIGPEVTGAPPAGPPHPPPGFTPILHSKHIGGGWHKLIGDHWEQWYAKTPDQRAKTRAATFPADLSKLKHVKNLGGSTGASLVEDEHGRQFVKKHGAHADHLREEYVADEAYRALGVSVPPSKLYDEGGKPTKLSLYLEGARPLRDVLQEGDFDLDAAGVAGRARKTLADGFVADVLLGNWDVTGLDMDNVLVHPTAGHAYRIDNGGALRYRAQGASKGNAWNEHPTEVMTLRHHGEGPSNTSKQVFAHITLADIKKSLADITPRLQHLADAMFEAQSDKSANAPLVKAVMDRYKNLNNAALNAKTEDEFKANLKKNGAKW